MKEMIAKLGCTEKFDKENVPINIFTYLFENRIELTDGLQVFIELSRLRDRTLSDGSESYFEEYEYSEIFMKVLKIWSNDEIVKIYDDLYKAKAYDKIDTWGNAAQRLCGRCAVRFLVRLYRNFAGILTYVNKFLCKMTENMPADSVQSLCGVALDK